MSAPPSGLSSYASQVAARLRGLPPDQRREVADDVQQRLADMGIVSWEAAVDRLGAPATYAEELREAAGWPRSRARRWPWVALLVVAVAAGGVVIWQRVTAVPQDYPLRFGSSMVTQPASVAGSVVVMPSRAGAVVAVAFELDNQGDRTVRLDGLQSFVGASTDGGLIAVGSSDDSPLWAPEARVFRLDDPNVVTLKVFDDASGSDLAGFIIAPGETVVLQLQGPMKYCVDAEPGTAVGDHIRLDTTIDGEHRVIVGTELNFPLGNCS
jgi:hypothetical protein